MLVELDKRGISCFMWVYVYYGAFEYADDLKLLTLTVQALHILTNIHVEYAAKNDILIGKSLQVIYKCTRNILLLTFKWANINMGHVLFQNYCTSFYGSQILLLFGTCMEDIYTTYRAAMHRVWQVLCRTNNNILPHFAGVMDPELWFACQKVYQIYKCDICMKSDNNTVKTISMMGVNGLYSVLGANYRELCSTYVEFKYCNEHMK